MRLASISIKNLRAFADVQIPISNYTCLVGPNGAGKSTVLYALNVFFREGGTIGQLDAEDFHCKDTSKPVEITLSFTDLQAEAQKDFADYYRHGQLVVSAVATFDESTGKADVKQYGKRLAMAEFQEFFSALGDNRKVAELRDLYTEIRRNLPQLPAATTKDAMVDALRQYEAAHADACVLIPSEDQFYGVSKGANRLAKYIQWVFVPAVKDATREQIEARDTALGKLLARTVRSKANFEEGIGALRAQAQERYQELLAANQPVLDGISAALRARLTSWAHPGATLRLEWTQDPEKSVQIDEPFAHLIAGENGFEGQLSRFGHGFQRSYLLALLQELAGSDDANAPRLLLGCEEPELYQHPPQARHLADVLRRLSEGNSQIIVSTHSPTFVTGEGFEDVRMVRKHGGGIRSVVSHMSYDEIATAIASATETPPKKTAGILAKIHQCLQPHRSEMFFANRLVLVEGLEDVAYITAYLNLLDKWDAYRRAGCHIVSVNGKSEMLQPLVIAKHIGIPTYVVFDADAQSPDKAGSRAKHEADNKALLRLVGQSGADPMPAATLWGKGFVMWHSTIRDVVAAEIGSDEWAEAQSKADAQYGQAGNLQKNTLHIGASLAFAWSAGKRSTQLERLCRAILDHTDSI